MPMNRIWTEETTPDAAHLPLLAFAVHHGHSVRAEISHALALNDAERLREEDPFTGDWTSVAPTRIIGTTSRFEVDLNRPREKAVYRTPADAWGLKVWKQPLSNAAAEQSLREYDRFYAAMDVLLSRAATRHGKFLILDLHSYNHRRDGPDRPADPNQDNPQVNIGTGTMDRSRWGPVVDTLIEALGDHPFPGGPLDVRENVRFRGGHFPRWVHERFPDTGCAVAIEFKKFFMDEWTGEPNRATIDAVTEALAATVPPTLEALARL